MTNIVYSLNMFTVLAIRFCCNFIQIEETWKEVSHFLPCLHLAQLVDLRTR